ncbi:accessory gene regulator B family protein [Clostridium sp. DJ247]|uniref:accessory gene regulator ArgB-like protein n=1 Tax=Clostridium sp. DJ247 TaxID=2726188 RepID=UPI0016292A2E|nr:accessory gene regulator B family protein [Clostridium sp. DJ247]
MVSKLTAFITLNLSKRVPLNSEEIEKINYILIVILGESFKLLVLLLIFKLLGKLVIFLFSLLILFCIRTYSGGIHFEKSYNCLFSSIIFFLITCLLPEYIPNLPSAYYYTIAIFCIIIVAVASPKPSSYRPIKNPKKRRNFKIISILSIIIWLYILLFHVKNLYFLNCGLLTIMLQSIQLINISFINGGLKYEKNI